MTRSRSGAPLARSDHRQGLSRRQVLQLASLAAGSAAFSVACGTASSSDPSPTSGSTPTAAGGNATAAAPSPGTATANSAAVSRVVLIRSEDRVAGTQAAIDLLQPTGIRGQTVFLKPNYNTGDPAPAATDTALLEALVRELQNAGAGAITVGDRSGMADTRRAMESKGVFALADRLGLQALVLDEMDRDGWQYVAAEGTHWPKGFAFAVPALDTGAVVNTCCLKTHRFGGHFTLSLKNTVGLVAKTVPGDPHNDMGDLHSSPHQHRMIAEINQACTPALVLLDGVEAFVNGGPEAGRKARPGVILAGTDRVAVDVAAVAILRGPARKPPPARQGTRWSPRRPLCGRSAMKAKVSHQRGRRGGSTVPAGGALPSSSTWNPFGAWVRARRPARGGFLRAGADGSCLPWGHRQGVAGPPAPLWLTANPSGTAGGRTSRRPQAGGAPHPGGGTDGKDPQALPPLQRKGRWRQSLYSSRLPEDIESQQDHLQRIRQRELPGQCCEREFLSTFQPEASA